MIPKGDHILTPGDMNASLHSRRDMAYMIKEVCCYPGSCIIHGPDTITTVLRRKMQVGENHRRRQCDDGSRGWSDEP